MELALLTTPQRGVLPPCRLHQMSTMVVVMMITIGYIPQRNSCMKL